MKLTKIANRNLIFTTKITEDCDVNLGLILGEHRNYIIDTGTGENNAAEMMSYVTDKCKPIVVINTHAHSDHIIGNSYFKESTIVSHTLCREIMDNQWSNEIASGIHRNKQFYDSSFSKCLPNLVFDKEICFLDDGIKIFHSPFHTEDSISIYDSVDRVLYTGDNFDIEEDKVYLWEEDIMPFKPILEKYKQCDFDFCIPSHSESQTYAVIQRLEECFE